MSDPALPPASRSLPELLSDSSLTRDICRQMCRHDGVEPDAVMTAYLGRAIKNWEYHVANVNAVLRAMKAIAS